MRTILEWFKKYLSDPQVIILILLGSFILLIFITLGQILTPVIASLVLAYLLEGLIRPIEKKRLPRLAAVTIVFCIFLLVLIFLVLGLIPLLSKQIVQFVQDLPQMLSTWHEQLQTLPQKYPQFITQNQLNRLLESITNQVGILGQNFLSFSIASVRSVINIVVYIVLVPLMTFFFLKDKEKILNFIVNFLPENIDLASQVWQDVNHKIAKFIQGKILEILIIWFASYIVFYFFDLKFSVLLSFLVGISVIIPYVGAIVMTVPVALVSYFQWGWDPQFAYVLISYFILQLLDGNLLAPILLAEIVNLHPLAVIVGILVFGGIWGMWGVVFAIPLATLVHAIIKAWPQKDKY